MLSFFLLLVLATGVRAHFSQCGNGVEGAEGVKVTNLSPALNLTAPFLISHHKDVKLFAFGKPASAELKSFAETGSTAAFEAYIKTAEVASFVCGHFIADAPVAPGQSNYYEIPMVETENCTCSDAAVSVFTKVELMNDAFAALNTVLIPVVPVETLDEHHAGWTPYLVPAYDAGTQANTEKCVDFGLDNCADYTVAPKTAVATVAAGLKGEGFIHVSGGIRDRADIASLKYGFQNPIALIELHGRLPNGIVSDDLPITTFKDPKYVKME